MYLQDMFLGLDKTGKTVPRLQAITDLIPKEEQRRARTILGSTLVDAIQNDIIPGFKRIAEASASAGQAGVNVRGAAAEQVIGGIGEAGGRLVQGKPEKGAVAIIGDLINMKAYSTAAKLLTTAAGASGMRSRAAFLSDLDKLAQGAGSAAGRQVIRNAEKARTEMEEQGALNRSR
mgnify:CR=1 FL=1